MRFTIRSVVACSLLVAMLGLGTNVSSAEPSDPPTCDPASAAQITAVLNADGHATFTVGNALPLCDPVPIGVASYVKNADGFVVPQTLFDSATDTITTGSKTLSVSLPTTGKPPACFTQLDAFTGAPLPQITDTEQYGSRLLAWTWGTTPTCAEVEAKTETPPTTETPTTESTQPQVEAVEVTPVAEVAPQEQPKVLARTGPSKNVRPLLAVSGWLLIIGGALVALSTRERVHAL